MLNLLSKHVYDFLTIIEWLLNIFKLVDHIKIFKHDKGTTFSYLLIPGSNFRGQTFQQFSQNHI